MRFKKITSLIGCGLGVIFIPAYLLTKIPIIGLIGYISLLLGNIMILLTALAQKKGQRDDLKGQGAVSDGSAVPSGTDEIGPK